MWLFSNFACTVNLIDMIQNVLNLLETAVNCHFLTLFCLHTALFVKMWCTKKYNCLW